MAATIITALVTNITGVAITTIIIVAVIIIDFTVMVSTSTLTMAVATIMSIIEAELIKAVDLYLRNGSMVYLSRLGEFAGKTY